MTETVEEFLARGGSITKIDLDVCTFKNESQAIRASKQRLNEENYAEFCKNQEEKKHEHD